ncbi:hypothetical protein Bbelb_391440 [Branchiostoma belcheri]|nr:hypothetical protein Bbelb_391440 [Branchiostoma belcheri]
MSDFPQRLHKFTEALKGLVQSYPKVTVWDHRRLWRRNPNYFAPHACSLMLPPDPPRNLEVHSSSGKNPPFQILATGMRLTAYTCPIWETSSITRVILAPTSDTPTRTVNVGSGHRVVTGIAVSVPTRRARRRGRTRVAVRTPDHLPRGLVRTTALLSTSDNRPPKRCPGRRAWRYVAPLPSLNQGYRLKKEQWTTNIIIPLPEKGNLFLMTNYRGISLLSIAAKVYNKILLNRIRSSVN